MLLGSLAVGQIGGLIGVDVIPVGLLFLVGFAGSLILGWALLHRTLERQKLVNDHIRKTGGDSRLSAHDRLRVLSDYDNLHNRHM